MTSIELTDTTSMRAQTLNINLILHVFGLKNMVLKFILLFHRNCFLAMFQEVNVIVFWHLRPILAHLGDIQDQDIMGDLEK